MGASEHEQVFNSAKQSMTMVQATCRQTYNEARFLPYELNESCFQNETALKLWRKSKIPVHERAVNAICLHESWLAKWKLYSLNHMVPRSLCGFRIMKLSSQRGRRREHESVASQFTHQETEKRYL